MLAPFRTVVLSLSVGSACLAETAQRGRLDNEVLIETEPFQDRFPGVDRVRRARIRSFQQSLYFRAIQSALVTLQFFRPNGSISRGRKIVN